MCTVYAYPCVGVFQSRAIEFRRAIAATCNNKLFWGGKVSRSRHQIYCVYCKKKANLLLALVLLVFVFVCLLVGWLVGWWLLVVVVAVVRLFACSFVWSVVCHESQALSLRLEFMFMRCVVSFGEPRTCSDPAGRKRAQSP